MQKKYKILFFSSISLLFLTFGLKSSISKVEALIVKNNAGSSLVAAQSSEDTAAISSTDAAVSGSSTAALNNTQERNTYSRGGGDRELAISEPDADIIPGSDTNANTVDSKIRIGDSGEEVLKLQQNLKKMGFFKDEPSGFFGLVTNDAVVDFQVQLGLMPDGIVGTDTLKSIDSALTKGITAIPKKQNSETVVNTTKAAQSQQSNTVQKAQNVQSAQPEQKSSGKVELLSWFGGAENVFSIGSTAKVIDVDTGISFRVKRTYGYNHADCETATAEDTRILKDIAGGFNWTRRAIIVEVNGRRIAASIAPMPHAGLDSKPANAEVSGRSGGYGTGTNLDSVKGNAMDGHFDIHFYNSRTHASNSVDSNHQAMVQKAYRSGN